MAEMLGQMSSWLTLLPRISLGNILEMVIISFLVYEILVWIKNTRAYYYYVKAVPKMNVSTPDVKVQKISSRKRSTRERNVY